MSTGGHSIILPSPLLSALMDVYEWESCPRVTLQPSHPGYSSRRILRHGIVLVCLLLLGLCFVGVTLNPLYKMQGVGSATQESVSQLSTAVRPFGLNFMDGKKVVLVSHELSLSGEILPPHFSDVPVSPYGLRMYVI